MSIERIKLITKAIYQSLHIWNVVYFMYNVTERGWAKNARFCRINWYSIYRMFCLISTRTSENMCPGLQNYFGNINPLLMRLFICVDLHWSNAADKKRTLHVMKTFSGTSSKWLSITTTGSPYGQDLTAGSIFIFFPSLLAKRFQT